MNASRDFSARTVKGLARKGIFIVGSQAAPAFDGDEFFTGVVYLVDNNDQGQVKTFSQVLAM